MAFGISKELVSGDESQAALEIAKVATVTRPIWAMHKQSDEGLYDRLPEMWEGVKDFAQKAWERDDVKRTLGGAAGGAGLGALNSLAGGGDLLRNMITGGLAGGGVGLGYHALRNWADDKDIIQPWDAPGVPDLYDQGMADLNMIDPEVVADEVQRAAEIESNREFAPNIPFTNTKVPIGETFGAAADALESVHQLTGDTPTEKLTTGTILTGGTLAAAATGTPLADVGLSTVNKFNNFVKRRRGMMGGSQQGFIDDLRKWLVAGGDGIDPKQHAAILDAVGKMPEKDFLKAMQNLQQGSLNPFNKLFWKIPSGPVPHAINAVDGLVPAPTNSANRTQLQQMFANTKPPAKPPLINEITIKKLREIIKGNQVRRAPWNLTKKVLGTRPIRRVGGVAGLGFALPWLFGLLSDNYHMSPADQARLDANNAIYGAPKAGP